MADRPGAHRPDGSAGGRHRDRGSITAEFAAALPAVLVVLALCLGAVQVMGQQVRMSDAAAYMARLLARGDGAGSATGLLAAVAPGAVLAEERQGEFVCARLSAPSAFAPFAAAGLTLGARSCALASDTASADP
ncbi:TadE family type IV pilus minor pilin [Cryobacterium lactosi]|uniref:TadE family type IV pilus minor pilin n=1 Tax=Cryobacterium lactosi TaxID=1259202 RepID=UPI00157FE4DA|nr:TadE family type IV pilus minor pilin [Cryobacterium lactosi]